MKKVWSSGDDERLCEETIETTEILPSMSLLSTHDSDRTPRTMMNMQYESKLEKKTWTKQFGALNGDPKTGKPHDFRRLARIQTTGKIYAEKTEVDTPELFRAFLQLSWKGYDLKQGNDDLFKNTVTMLIDFARCFGPEVMISLPDQAKLLIHKTSADPMSKQWKRVGWSLKRQPNQLLNEKEVKFWNAQGKANELKTKYLKKLPNRPDEL